jgi:methylenetetrahydrofolate--tRNA-(uracil-5-)-methyltransferase
VESAAGLLKEEMRRLGSLCVETALQCAVPAGGALAVDRDRFSEKITGRITEHPLITVEHREMTGIPKQGITVIATGPLTSDSLAQALQLLCGGSLSFYDAAAPIVSAESVDMTSAFRASRYDKEESGQGDYINCPMNREEYEAFHTALITAETAPLHAFDNDQKVYEGCMPIEVLAKRGADSMRDPRTGHRPWAVLQLRMENTNGTLLNLVGFQTNLKFGEQKRVFGMIPALHDAEFIRYGVMHRNTFLDSPRLLTAGYQFRDNPNLFFAGQMTGVEGYMESASSGILAGINAARTFRGQPPLLLARETMMGALAGVISESATTDFQPMGANFGILPPLPAHIRDKKQRYAAFAERALSILSENMV